MYIEFQFFKMKNCASVLHNNVNIHSITELYTLNGEHSKCYTVHFSKSLKISCAGLQAWSAEMDVRVCEL